MSTKTINESWYENGSQASREVRYGNFTFFEREEWYKNEKLKSSASKTKSQEWYENGTLKYVKRTVPNDKHLVQETYYENGKPSVFTYNDHPDGLTCEAWYENGQMHQRNTSLDDTYTEWYKNGQVSHQHEFVDGRIETQRWYEDGVQEFGESKGTATEWYNSGMISSIRTDEPTDTHAVSKSYHETGELMSVGYQNHPDGLIEETWFMNGEIKTRRSRVPDV
jgi:antitoxin component YwqK of YwqJK toxin-antitoxin module